MMSLHIPFYFRLTMELFLAAFLGALVGFEREMHGQGAGFRTNIIICLAACLLMQLSINLETIFRHLNQNSVVRIDPGRIASYAVAGMGFLGAGAIIKGHGSVRGLTTAASLWLLTGVGLAVGAGFYVSAFVTILISVIVLYGLRKFKTRFVKEYHTNIRLFIDENICNFNKIEKIISDYGDISIEFINFQRDLVKKISIYDLKIVSTGDQEWRKVSKALTGIEGINEISWTEGTVT